ncbi:alpha,alpha-trehalase TreA [Vulcaniibacterium tengchongense]|uniref:Periplasmic trehalase n=1 Tax=Vulcaniibacterium tengchongense TaxID=1273429 RepID=A0A3N4VL33_9GAMM|nr:alpha,alpha-trehalase [Vulcaniibacterium tengchongense]
MRDRSLFRAPLLALCLAVLAAPACAPQPRADVAPPRGAVAEPPRAPDQAYPELFDAVQRARLFEDQKHFADMVPRREPARIRADYLARRDAPGFDLAAFVADHFDEPAAAEAGAVRAENDLRRHIDALWPVLTRRPSDAPRHGSLLPLPQPYVVPGGRFREIYYWDSYFTMLGLAEGGQAQRVRDMLDNFAYLIDRYGHIPNGNRSYYLSRSQPPFFAYMVELEARRGGDAVYRRYLPQLRREHAYWMQGAHTLAPGEASRRVVRLADGSLLNRYWDERDAPRPESYLQDLETAAQAPRRAPGEVYRDLRAAAESGWDFSSRWLGDRKSLGTIRTTAIVPVDLNSLLYHLESVIAVACEKDAQPACTEDFRGRAQRRRAAIEQHLWNPAGYYADYDWKAGKVSDQVTAAALFPLYAGLAAPGRAQRTAATVRARLVRPGGLVTTELNTGQQWDAPNAWAPLQWVAVEGLRRYGEDALAETIGRNFLAQVDALFRRERKLVEKYDAEGLKGGGGGEYPLQDGFGWTNGVTLKLLALYGPRLARARAQDARPAAAAH